MADIGDISEPRRFLHENAKIYDVRERELNEYRKRIEEQERALDEYRTKLKNEQLAREKEFQRVLEERERFFSDRERSLFERQKEFEKTLYSREKESEELRLRLEQEISSREAQLLQTKIELQKEKERYKEESIKKIERTSKDYVSEALELLGKKETDFHNRSKTWAAIGAVSLVMGLIFFGYITVMTLSSLPNSVTWEFIVFSMFKGLISVALFAALAKYSLLFSNSYMREALKNGDRRHAINFGKFYLESYGAAADWNQIKEAFEHWNITGENAFSKQTEAKFDVTSVDRIIGAIESIGKTIPNKIKEKIA